MGVVDVDRPAFLEEMMDGLFPTGEVRKPPDAALGGEDHVVGPMVDVSEGHDVGFDEPGVHVEITGQKIRIMDVFRNEVHTVTSAPVLH